jgi:hypothetical protein
VDDDPSEDRPSVKLFWSLGKGDELKSMDEKSLGAQRYSAATRCKWNSTV